MKSRMFIDSLLDAMPCRNNYDFRVVDRPTGGMVIKIGKLVEAGIGTDNAATIWERPNGQIRVEIFEHSRPNYHDWPEKDVAAIAREVCDFCVRKMTRLGY